MGGCGREVQDPLVTGITIMSLCLEKQWNCLNLVIKLLLAEEVSGFYITFRHPGFGPFQHVSPVCLLKTEGLFLGEKTWSREVFGNEMGLICPKSQ